MPTPKTRSIGEIIWTTIRTYAIPFGIFAAVVRLWSALPRFVLVTLLAIIPLYISWEISRQMLTRRRVVRELTRRYESIVRLGLTFGRERDNENRFSLVERTLYVSRPDAREVVIEHGMNVSGGDHGSGVRKIAADAPVEPQQLKFRSTLSINGNPPIQVTPTFQSDQQGREITVAMSYRGSIIRPSDMFRLEWEYSLPRSVAKEQEYWVCGRRGSDMPVATLRLKICFQVVPADIRLTGSALDELIPIVGPREEADIDGVAWHVFSAEIKQPSAQLHLWQWTYDAPEKLLSGVLA
jgi:hypothetical protein